LPPAGAAPQVTDAAFARRMRAFAPFEPEPVLCVAVSGGADSLCLALLADRWARARGGRVEAVTVDHGLRPESAAEARQVAHWLKARGIRHRILRWQGAKPASDLAAAARAARYALLADWAAARGILHLLLAHHRDDQAETVLLRLGRGSGVDGLAAMAGAVELARVRLLRPLLDLPKARLVATLTAARQAWAEDPGNLAGASARSRVRLALAELGRDGIAPDRLAATAARIGRARQALEAATTALLAAAVAIYPTGYLRLDPAAFAAAPAEIRLRALARCLMAVSGDAYPPRLERLERLDGALFHKRAARGQTLHGCQFVPEGARWLVVREPASIAAPVPLDRGRDQVWDRRFLIRASAIKALPANARIGALGAAGYAALRPAAARLGLPRPAALALPAFYANGAVLAAPFLGLPGGDFAAERGGRERPQADRIINQSAVFMPSGLLAPMAYAVAPAAARTI